MSIQEKVEQIILIKEHHHNIQFKFCDFYQIKFSTIILIIENITCITNIYDSAALYPYKKMLNMIILIKDHYQNKQLFLSEKISTTIIIIENIITTAMILLLYTRKSSCHNQIVLPYNKKKFSRAILIKKKKTVKILQILSEYIYYDNYHHRKHYIYSYDSTALYPYQKKLSTTMVVKK